MDTSIIVFGMEYNDKDPDEQFSSRTPRIYKFNKLASHQNDKSIFPKKGYTLINIDRMNKEDFILCYKRYENNRFVYGAAIVDANAKLKKQKDFTQMAIDNIKFVDSENIFLTGITVDNENGYFNIFKITENFDITAENSIKYAAANKIGFVNYGIFNINENTFVTFINARNDKFQEICVAIVFDNQCNIIDKIEMPKLDIKQPYEKIKSIIQIEPTIFLFSGYLGDIINAKAFIRLISLDGKTISVKYSKNPNNTYINYCAVKNKNDEIITIGTQAKINNSPVDVNIVNYGKLKYPKPKEYKVSKILKPVSSGNISVSSQPSEKSADLMQTTKTTSYQSSKDESDEPYYLTDENNKVYEALILNSKYDSLLKIKKIFQRRNSNYVLLAEIMNGPNREPGIDGLMLIELDKNYKIIWRENIFSLEQYNYELLSCFENNNNELFVITNAIKTKTINDKTVYFSKVEILKVDKGAIISRNEINFSNNIWCFGAYKIKENELILLLVDNENPTAKKYFAVKTDFVGKIISKKILSNSENHTKSIIDKNNGIFTVGVNFDKRTVSFAKYNAAAGLEWAKEYPQSNFLVKDIIQTENGNYIIAGIEQTLSYSKIALFILDANGNLVKYENAYQPFKDNYCNVFQIAILENDNYLILGSIDAKTAEKVFNMAINANGIPLYHKVEEKPEAHYTPNSMLIDNDKNLII
ncbi:MAG TPA: hypothetical protein PLJ38_06085, partial [bacterium]|nr:hypothetical protein [bacterium]